MTKFWNRRGTGLGHHCDPNNDAVMVAGDITIIFLSLCSVGRRGPNSPRDSHRSPSYGNGATRRQTGRLAGA